jgi:hypothetical protein
MTQFGNLGLADDRSSLVVDALRPKQASGSFVRGRWFGL